MIIIIAVVCGVMLFMEFFTSDGFVYDEMSMWHDEYQKEIEKIHKQGRYASTDSDEVFHKIEQKAKKYRRNAEIIFVICCIFIVLDIMCGTYEETQTMKYELLPIQEEEILEGLSQDKVYYICEYLNQEHSYMFYYKGEKGPEKKEIFSDHIIQYENTNGNCLYVKEQKKISKTRYNILQNILFFQFLLSENETVLEDNYWFYIPEENILKTFK